LAKKQEQPDLIDVTPENQKKIVAAAKKYRGHLRDRVDALTKEKAAKAELLEEIKKANLQPLADGSIQTHVEGFTITVKRSKEQIEVVADEDQE
jgi:hypothetical protein